MRQYIMNSYRLQYDCKTYQNILKYAMNAEWPGDSKRPSSRRQFINMPAFLLEEPILKILSGFCSYMDIMKMEPRSVFREHMDGPRKCGLNLCLHDVESHTFILEPDVYLSEENSQKYLNNRKAIRDMENPWNIIENNCALYEEPQYEPSGIYLLNTSRRHGVINYSYEPRYSGFFTINKEIDYEAARELLMMLKVTENAREKIIHNSTSIF